MVRVEIQRIDPPPDVVAAMHGQMRAERERGAVVTTALGEGEAAITRATFAAIHQGGPTPDLIAIKYLEMGQVADGRATKVFRPSAPPPPPLPPAPPE